MVERDCSVTHRDNFACIGTGAYIAEPALYQRHQSRAFTLGKTLYHTYEAKRLGEIAEGVGHHTIIIAVAPPGKFENRFMPISLDGIEFLEKQYQKYGLKSTLKFKWPKAKKSLRTESEVIRTASKKSRFL